VRRILLAVLAGLLALAGVLLANALRPGLPQEPAAPAPPLALDREALARRLALAIQVPTVSRGEDAPPDLDAFRELHRRLERSFPRLHASLTREVVGGASLLYRWPGRDPQTPPILLMGHLDVVPVEPGSEGRWTQPPFGGAIDGAFVWGRGALDDKVSVLGVAEAVEHLLGRGFAPRRTVYLAFGHDEEQGGEAGAAAVARLLAERGVALEFTIDEGMGIVTRGLVPGVTSDVALIGLAEKGYLSLELTARAAGGHSSTPPRESAIGRLSRALARLEARPLPEAVRGPVAAMFDSLAGEAALPMRVVLRNRWLFDPAIRAALRREPAQAAMLHTTTAPTLLRAGVKDNVLPSLAQGVVNFRILPGDTVDGVVAHVRRALGDDGIELRVLSAREPTPSGDPGSASYRAVARTIREVFPEAVVAPALVVGGTDSRHYTAVARQSFRFVPLRLAPEDLKRIHGTDERVAIDDYLGVVRFFVRLLENAAGDPGRS
jgi:carboxypeptidase PM20D1